MFQGMKSLLPVAVLALALGGLAPAQGHAQSRPQSDDEKALRRLKEVEWPKAYKEQDVALLDRILADEFQMVDADGNKSTKAQELDWVRNNKPGYDSLTFEITRLDIFENGTAIVAGTGTIRDNGSVTEYQSSNVLVKRSGAWKAVASHVSGVKPKEPAAPADPPTERDVAILREKIRQSGEAFNNVDPDAIIAPYARDVVLSYPGVPDMGYETLAKAYAGLRDRKDVVEKTVPTIEEILVSGDLGIIRVMWNTTTTEVATGRQSSRQMKDLQVWRKEKDGTWMFIRGMHFRMPPPPVAAPAVQVPKGEPVVLDGHISDGEWKGAEKRPLVGGGEMRLLQDGSNLYVGVKGLRHGWSHVYVADGDQVYVLHASAALGEALYRRGEAELWQPAQSFSWSMRQKDQSDETARARAAFFDSHGWLANNNLTGRPMELEFKLKQSLVKGDGIQLAAVFASDANSPQYWPETLADDSLKAELIFGNTPADLKFNPASWARLKF